MLREPFRRLRFGSGELSGAFGDLGTDLPLVTGMILAAGLDPASAFLMFGSLQICSALVYGIPMPVQPLKAVAALVIAQGLGEPVIRGAALAVAVIMGLLTFTGGVDRLARLVPPVVVRGIQVGLGVKLGLLALGRYVPAEGQAGFLLAAGCTVLLVVLLKQPRFPAAVAVLLVGVGWAVWRGADPSGPALATVGAPGAAWPTWEAMGTGLVLLALPQIPLSLGNSVLATRQLAADWFPASRISLRRIGTTYSLFNAAVAAVGGIPVCHGSGGMAGHYAMGGRTGGSVIYYGVFYLGLAAAVTAGVGNVTALFPLPVLGVILAFEAGALVLRLRGVRRSWTDTLIVLVVAATANLVPYGFLVGMIAGAVLAGAFKVLATGRGGWWDSRTKRG